MSSPDDVPTTSTDAPTDPSSGGSRTGVIVGVGAAALVVLVLIVVLLLRDDDGDATATPTPDATATATVTATPTPTPTPTTSADPTATASPSPDPDDVVLRPDGVGPLDLRMTKDEALATEVVTEEEFEGLVELVPDPDVLPGVFICWDETADELTSFTVKDGSPIETPEGIGVDSSVDDLRTAFGTDLDERTENGTDWYVVEVDDAGYAFFPTDTELIMLSGTDGVLEDVLPESEPC